MPGSYHVSVKGGDRVLVDLGGFGVLLHLDNGGEFYDAEYVKIQYGKGGPKPSNLPADMIVTRWGDKKLKFPQANSVRIWRHKAR